MALVPLEDLPAGLSGNAVPLSDLLDSPAAKPKERTWGEAASDTGASLVSGLGSLVQVPSQIYGLATGDFSDTGLMALGKGIQKTGNEWKSEALRQKELQRAAKTAEAEKEGLLSEFKTFVGETVKDPALLTSLLTEQAPQVIGPGLLGKGVKGIVFAKETLKGAAEKEAAAAAAKAGVGTAVGTNVVMQGADIGAGAYEETYNEMIRRGVDPQTAKDEALSLARMSGASGAVISLLTQRLPGSRTIEKALVGVPGASGRLAGAGKGFLGEGISEALEEGGGKLTQNVAMYQVDPTTELLRGVGTAAGMGAVGGGAFGTIGGALRTPEGKIKEGAQAEETRVETKPATPPSTLLLPSPEEIIVNQRQYDPLQNPLGNFTANELTPEQIKYIDADRKNNGKPRLASYSLEDLVDAINYSSDTPEAKLGAINTLLTFKSGYTGEETLTPQSVINMAGMKNIETQTTGFNDFLRRTTGETDMGVMSQPQLYSAFNALSRLPVSEELQILPEGTNAVRFSEKQYADALKGLEGVYDEFGTNALSRTSVIQEIQDFSGLERAADAEALYKQALKNNDLEETLRQVKTTEGVKTVPEVSFAGKIEPLPSGFEIVEQEFKQGVMPESYEIRNGNKFIESVKSLDEANKVVEKTTKINEKLAKEQLTKLDKLNKAIEKNNNTLDIQKAKGLSSSLGFQKLAANFDFKNKTIQKEIQKEQSDYNYYTNPLQIVPIGEKPVTAKKQVFYEDGKPVASFGDKYQAEQFGIMKLDDAILQQIIDSAPTTKGILPKRYAAFAAKEIERRAGKAPKGIEVKRSIYADKVNEDFEKLQKTLLPALKRFGLDSVALRIVDSIADGKADGSYVKELIKIAYNAENPMGTLRHESIHALKELGAFTDTEWKVLSNKAKSDWIDTYIKKPNLYKSYQDAYKAENGNLKGFDEYIQEEAIAEAFRDFANTKPPAGLIGNIFYRLNKMFEALGNTFKRLGYTTAGDIFAKVERGEAKPTRQAVSQAVSQAEKFAKKPEEIRKIGENLVGAPPDMKTEKDRTALVKRMTNLLEHPYSMYSKSKDWYERSGDTIAEIAHGDKALMEKIVRLTALYSQANSLGGNITAVIKSMKQLAEGNETAYAGRFPETTAKVIPQILAAKNFDTDLAGVNDKLMNFYHNLHDGTFKTDTFADASTIDRWMMRLFGYPHSEDQVEGGANSVSATQYKYAKDLVSRIADANEKRTGERLLPRQIQAVLWTYIKNTTEYNNAKEKGKGAEFKPSSLDFSDYVNRATANITWESRPSTKIDLLKGIHTAPRKDQDAFNRAVRSIFETESGDNKIFKLLNEGVLYSSQNSIGAYENQIAPNVITRLVLNKDDKGHMTDVANKTAAIIGYVTKQDAVPWYRADPTATGAKGYKVSASITPDEAFEDKLFKHLNEAVPGIGFTRVDNSFDFINFRGDDKKPYLMSDAKYIQALQNALETFPSDVVFNIDPFRVESEYIFNDWKEDTNGEGYLKYFSARELTDIQPTIDGWRKNYDSIAKRFGKEYGWDKDEGAEGEGVERGERLQIRAPKTPEFKQWFGNSKVVDEDGNPLLVYRGQRRDVGAESTDLAIRATPSFTDNQFVASVYSYAKSKGKYTEGAYIAPSYIKMVSPIDLREFGNEPKPLIDLLEASGISGLEESPNVALNILKDLDSIQDKTGFESSSYSGNYEYVSEAYDALNNAINQNLDVDTLGSLTFDILEDLRVDAFALPDSPTVVEYVKEYNSRADGFIVRDAISYSAMELMGKENLKTLGSDGGYDAYRPFEQNQIKSAFNQKPTESKDVRYQIKAPKTQEFDNWFRDSLLINEDGSPMVVYHGTTAVDKNGKPYDTFKLSKEGALGSGIYMTPEPDYANNYAGIPRPEVIDSMERLGQTAITDPLREAQRTGEGFPTGRMIPLFASIESPLVIELDGRGDPAKLGLMELGVSEEKAEAIVEKAYEDKGGLTKELMVRAKNQGHDGIFLYRDGKLSEVVAFSPSQVKSVFNQTPYSGIKRFQLKTQQDFDVEDTGRKDNLIFLLQDKQIDLKRIIDGLKAQGKEIADKWNAYLQEELFHGRSATRVKFFINRELNPLLSQMNSAGITLEQMDDYLLARHAKEANEYIRSINKDPKANAGMTDAEAEAYIKAIPPMRRQVFERLAGEVDKMTKETRQMMVDYGLETQATIDAWEKTYKNYVPLFREETEGSPISTGRGYNIRGSTTRSRTGSSKKVVDVMANVALQRERTIARGEKNRVGNALLGLILQNPNSDYWIAINPDDVTQDDLRSELIAMGLDPDVAENLSEKPKERKLNKDTGLYEYKTNPVWMQQPNVFMTRVNGQDRVMVFNENNERAARMAVIFNNLDQNQKGQALAMMGTAGQYFQEAINVVGKGTRYFAAINTQYNPAFSIYNFMRDVGGAVLNLQSTALKGKEYEVISNAFTALKAVYQDLRLERSGQQANSKWAEIFEEFELEGGKTGFRDLFNDSETRARALESELEAFKQGGARQKAKATFDWLSDFNEAIENAIRVSAYKSAKDMGMSPQQAASLAKNLTVNFNRTGAMSKSFTTLYAFFNASVQGSARIAQTLMNSDGTLSSAGKTIIKGGITLGIMQAVMMATAGFEEDEPPDFVKDKNFVIPYGDKKYIAIPMPLGFNVIPSFGRRIAEFVMSTDKNVGKAVFEMGNMILDGFNPLGSATFAQTLTPTLIDPIIALGENKDFAGKPISRDDINSLNPTPGYTRGRDNASALSTGLAYAVNLLSGGTEFKKGVISPTPDQIDYLIGQVTGGVGREVLKVEKSIGAAIKGEELATFNIPIVGRMIGDIKQKTVETSRFYDNVRTMNEHQQEIDGRLKQGEDIDAYLEKYPEAAMYKYADRVYNKINKLKQKRKALKESGGDDADLKAYDDAILEIMTNFNETIKDSK